MHKPGTLKPIGDMTPKEKATFFMGVYNAQADDYKAMVAKPNLAEDQIKILHAKKKVLTKVYPLIKTHNVYVDNGAKPTAESEQAIMDLLNQLTSMAFTAIE
jgi:hypothetical protein